MTCQKLGIPLRRRVPPWATGLTSLLTAATAQASGLRPDGGGDGIGFPFCLGSSLDLMGLVGFQAIALLSLTIVIFLMARSRRRRQRLDAEHLRQASEQADMAEMAAGVLHNVGNVLNSVNVSAAMSMDMLGRARVSRLRKAAAVLQEHRDHLEEFLSVDDRGRLLPKYLCDLADLIEKEHTSAMSELRSVTEQVEHIRQIITTQQAYARRSRDSEWVQVRHVIDDAVRINLLAINRHGIDLVVDCPILPPINTDKHRLLQILTNLLSNAKYALTSAQHRQRMLTITAVAEAPRWLRISVTDNGVGIAEADLERIFAYGFTRRAGGHGFGLYSARIAAEQLGGSLSVASDGPGAGATFTLRLPLSGEAAAGERHHPAAEAWH